MKLIEEFDTKTQQLTLTVGRISFTTHSVPVTVIGPAATESAKGPVAWSWSAKDRNGEIVALASITTNNAKNPTTRHQAERAMRKFIEGMLR